MTELWSCGGGTQSAAIAALIVSGRLPRPDLAVIIDTEREKSETWQYADAWLIPQLAAVGVTLHRVSKSAYATVDLYASNGDVLLPVYTSNGGKLQGFCSNEWKQRVAKRWARARGVEAARCWIGYSFDERERVKAPTERWWQLWYPLVERVVRRADCYRIVAEIGWPPPPRSACYMCPHQSNAEWRALRERAPEDFQKAIVIDELIREEDADMYVHRSGRPLRDANLADDDDRQGDLFGGCDSGHCFV
jgi:hypothetical protein